MTMATAIERVTFDSNGVTLVGNLYHPTDSEPDAPLPGIVVTGTWTSVKEQMANRYAQALAARGFAALSFDFTGYGDSAGQPRDYESPELKLRDIHAAVTYLTSRPDVNPDWIGALGVCASAGYTAVNAAHDPRVRALALIAPWLHNTDLVRDLYGGEAGVAERIRAGEQAREKYDATGQVDYVPAVSTDNPLAAMPFDIDFYQNPARGAITQWPNRFAAMAWPGWLTFDPISVAPQLSAPTLIVHSENAAIPAGTHQFIDALTVRKAVQWTDNTQFDFYDQPATVNRATEAAAKHFNKHLMAQTR